MAIAIYTYEYISAVFADYKYFYDAVVATENIIGVNMCRQVKCAGSGGQMRLKRLVHLICKIT